MLLCGPKRVFRHHVTLALHDLLWSPTEAISQHFLRRDPSVQIEISSNVKAHLNPKFFLR